MSYPVMVVFHGLMGYFMGMEYEWNLDYIISLWLIKHGQLENQQFISMIVPFECSLSEDYIILYRFWYQK